MKTAELIIHLKQPHEKQRLFIDSIKKRRVVRAGRRSGKTTGVSIMAVEQFLNGKRVLYAAPTLDQTQTFWWEVKNSLQPAVSAGYFHINQTEKYIEIPGTKQRIKAKTAHNADSLRGDWANFLILDEYQDTDPDAWELVGAPMLLDQDGDCVFIYTSKIGLPHIKKLVDNCNNNPDRWELFHFSSFNNPHISKSAINELANDMTDLAYRMEIMAEEIEDDPNALWNRDMIDHVSKAPQLYRIIVGVDPPGGKTECGIIVAGVAIVGGQDHVYILADYSLTGPPAVWGNECVKAYREWLADVIVAESNFGGDMVAHTIETIAPNIPVHMVRATRGKAVRAEPVVALYQNHAGLHRVHHVGAFPQLEQEQCNWIPGVSSYSPNRVDGLVWAVYGLVIDPAGMVEYGDSPTADYRG